ncbi:retrovirus-related Pol polyprotein from transposon opus [Trichonephila clavipes]|nr:retrovirus-related Pol polyprotein from transposon opus [Trichonephila clavipes]
MSFGLRNAPSTFQRFINEVLFGLEFVFPYLDDILVASENEEQHKTHLKLVFDRLQKYGLRVNISKSTLGVPHLEFLGYLITPEGSRPLPEKVDAILSYKLPETIHDLRTFLGLLNFYRRYLKNAAKYQSVLHEYLKGSKKNDKTKIVRTEEAKENFEKCKQDLAHATLLSFPDPNLQLALFTDASNFAIGSLLQQFEDGSWKPISFFF